MMTLGKKAIVAFDCIIVFVFPWRVFGCVVGGGIVEVLLVI